MLRYRQHDRAAHNHLAQCLAFNRFSVRSDNSTPHHFPERHLAKYLVANLIIKTRRHSSIDDALNPAERCRGIVSSAHAHIGTDWIHSMI